MKEELLKFCWNQLNQKSSNLKQRSIELKESLGSETKSSAGDKHETGRAMVQLEQEKLGKQLLDLDKTKATLQKVNVAKNSSKIVLGSLVKTSTANYFISVSVGLYKTENFTVFCISPGTPIAQLLLGKEQGGMVSFNGNEIVILEVL
ncbi:3-oxoacyl-ACP synthase [Flagellimonas pacifica]|uniref:3-oxoacyl-ACP synthase n=1 Tax=Flagellimonas pacifica TaxID=1247520 RepID=A0A285MCN0_9FLAO|nr:3-oxoacyl-ACP synthase [Allomuricauda parva]SNY94910.1 hypothetical protein SAMN06265377_0571 [Allomuricauda parva]